MATSASDILIRAVMQSTSGLPQDVIVNDFAFHQIAGVPTDAELTELGALVSDFYRADVATGQCVSDYIGESVNRGATHELQYYTITAGAMGSPRFTEDWLGPTAPAVTDNLPTECAAVISFHADLTGVLEESGATRPRARRRGRLFIGPLTLGAVTIGDPQPVLNTTFRTTMQQAMTNMCLNAQSNPQPANFSVWSRSDNVLREVVGGWTDNAPDTQRRRGQAATARATFSI